MMRRLPTAALLLGCLTAALIAAAIPLAIHAEDVAPNPTVTTPAGPGTPAGPTTQRGPTTPAGPTTPVSGYLSQLYRWFLGFVGVAALFAFVMGGVLYMFAGANITTTAQAKKWVTNGVLGLLIAAASYLLLRTINPELVGGFDIETLIRENIPKRSTP